MSGPSAASYTASAGLVLVGGLQLSEWALIVGIAMAIFTAGVNWHYKRQHLKISKSLAAAAIASGNVHRKRNGATPSDVLYQMGDGDG